MTVVDRVRRVRELSGLTARSLSMLAGLSPGLISLIENGVRSLGGDSATKLAIAVGVSLDWLLLGIGDEPTKEQIAQAIASRQPENAA